MSEYDFLDENGKFKKGNTPPAGFNVHPENRNSGGWRKVDTPRWNLEQLIKMNSGQLEEILANPKESEFNKSLASVILLTRNATDIDEAKKAWDILSGIIDQTYGKTPQVQMTVEADKENTDGANKVIKGILFP